MEGIHSVSARDGVLREVFSNILAYRDYSSGYIAKFVIEKDCMFTENANRSQRAGILDLNTFVPFAKSPPISRVFRETTLADELGSGMRNTYKYSKLYSGHDPQFIEGDVFRTVIPLTGVAVGRVGPQVSKITQDTPQDKTQDKTQDSQQVNPYVSSNTRTGKWGTGAIDEISSQLQIELPGLRGYSATNIKYMRAFYEEWSVTFAANHQLLADDLIGKKGDAIRQLTTGYLGN